MERSIGSLPGAHLIVRSAAFFSPNDEYNFAVAVTRTRLKERRFNAAGEQVVSPTYVPHLVDRVLDLAIDGETGIWHLAGDDAMSWAEFARQAAAACRLDTGLITEVPTANLMQSAARPRYAPLNSTTGLRRTRGPIAGDYRRKAVIRRLE